MCKNIINACKGRVGQHLVFSSIIESVNDVNKDLSEKQVLLGIVTQG
jgi:hypothetical protein